MSSYSRLRKELRLIVQNIDEENPKDIAYVYSGYAPLSVRLVELSCLIPPRISLNLEQTTTTTAVQSGNFPPISHFKKAFVWTNLF